MPRIARCLALVTLLAPLLGSAAPANASSQWFAGADFSVGGVAFSLGFSDYDRHHEAPRYYYRTERHLAYGDYACDSACYVRDDRYYHHPECPILLHHFDRDGFDPYTVWTVLPDGGVAYYRQSYSWRHDDHRGDSRFDDHRGRRGRRRGGRGDSDSDSDSGRRGSRRGWHGDSDVDSDSDWR